MNSARCFNCGLTNFGNQPSCSRCGTWLTQGSYSPGFEHRNAKPKKVHWFWAVKALAVSIVFFIVFSIGFAAMITILKMEKQHDTTPVAERTVSTDIDKPQDEERVISPMAEGLVRLSSIVAIIFIWIYFYKRRDPLAS